MIEPKAGPTAGSGVTRWCLAKEFDALYGIPRARIASREGVSMSTSPHRGEMDKEIHSRDALGVRVMPYNASNNSAEHHRVTPAPAVGPAFGSIMLCVCSPD